MRRVDQHTLNNGPHGDTRQRNPVIEFGCCYTTVIFERSCGLMGLRGLATSWLRGHTIGRTYAVLGRVPFELATVIGQ